MALGTTNRDGGKTSEAGHLRTIYKGFLGEVLSGLAISQRAAGANMSVDMAIGDCIIPRSDATYGHPAFNDAVLNTAVTAADPSNPRRDIFVIYIDYNQVPSNAVSNNTNGVVKVLIKAGTPAGSPADPTDAAIQAAVGAGNPFIKLARIRVGTGAASIGNAVIDDLRAMIMSTSTLNLGWQALSTAWDSWAYSAWDNTNKLATINVPDSTIFTLGQKVAYWQLTGGRKYGFIVKLVNATSIIVYQGTDYTLNNERVYLPAYSSDKAPSGFPLDPAKWTVTLSDTTSRSQATPTINVWYNLGSLSITIPIGAWSVGYSVLGEVVKSSSVVASSYLEVITLSTANNSESNVGFSNSIGLMSQVNATSATGYGTVAKRGTIIVSASTPYYLNARSIVNTCDTIFFRNDLVPLTIEATCAYL